MKRIYKVMIAVAVMVSALLCCCFSVSAETYQNQFIGEDSKISYFRYTTTDGVVHHVSDFTFGWSGSNFNTGFTTPSGELEIYNVLIAFEPDSDFIYYLDKSKYYTFSFTAGSIGDTSIVSSLADVAVALKDSSGNLAVSYNSTQGDTGSSYKWFHVTFTPEQIQRIDNIALVQFQFAYDPALVVDHKFIRFDFHSVATITETYPAVDQITNAIQDSTDQITNGWTPAPQDPAGSGTVDDYTAAEDQLINDAADGIEQANDMFLSLGDRLELYSGSFLALSGFVDRLVSEIPILSILLWISLTVGLFSLIFNLGQALFSERRWTASEARRQERDYRSTYRNRRGRGD